MPIARFVITTITLVCLAASAAVATRAIQFRTCAQVLAEGSGSPPPLFGELYPNIDPRYTGWMTTGVNRECFGRPPSTVVHHLRDAFGYFVLRASGVDLRLRLYAAMMVGHDGVRGLEPAAAEEFGRAPEKLNRKEVLWLLTVGERPSCSQRADLGGQENESCQRLLGYLKSAARKRESVW
ncbi:MAG: hypothetical protein AAF690_15300 [Acidobacteriota bacterium]